MGQRCWGDPVGLPVSGVRGSRSSCLVYDLCLARFGWRERRARDVVMPWGLRGAVRATWVWAWGFLICVGCEICAGFCSPKWLVWVFVEKSVTIRRSGVVGDVQAVHPGLAETGPGGVGRRWN